MRAFHRFLVAVGLAMPEKAKLPAEAIAVKEPLPENVSAEPSDAVMAFDEHLLERARTQWQFGDWQSLAGIHRDTVQHHPDKAKLSLLAAAGRLQIGQIDDATEYLRLARDWGVSKRLLARILAAGVHNSLGRASAVANQLERISGHFYKSVSVGAPGVDAKLLASARAGEQFNQLGVLPNSEDYRRVSDGATATRVSWQVRTGETTEKQLEKYANFSSAEYWEERYQKGGTSGYGSYGRLAEYKAKIINRFIEDEGVESVIEFGCGDGRQLSMLRVKTYVGVDVSSTVVKQCKRKFQADNSKTFCTSEEFSKSPQSADLTLSLDVIFHLIEDVVFEAYMKELFQSARRYCIIYACDEDWLEADAIHVRRRKFTEWIAQHIKNWRLSQITYNKYPHDGSGNPKNLSFSDFYFYERAR